MAVRNGMPDEVLGDLYPFEDKYVELPDGKQMHYIEAGRAGLRRPTFLLIHGNPTWSLLYRRFIEPLAKLGRVIAIDHMGFGRSDHPCEPEYYSLDQHIRNLEDFCAALRLKRVIPVVQDWGGPIGLGYATRHPDDIAGLVVLNTWAFTTKGAMRLPLWFKAMRRPKAANYLFGKRNLFVEKFIPRYTHADLPDHVMEGYRHPFTNQACRHGVIAFVQMVPDKPGHPDWDTLTEVQDGLSRLDVPALILFAADDPAFGEEEAHRFHELLPRAEAPRFFAGASHFLQEDIPETLLHEITDWVKSR